MMVNLVDGQRETKGKGAQYVRDQDYPFLVYFDMNQEAASNYGIVHPNNDAHRSGWPYRDRSTGDH